MKKLQILDLSYNKLSNVDDFEILFQEDSSRINRKRDTTNIITPPKLKAIYLQNNHLTNFDSMSFKKFSNTLQMLYLNNNSIAIVDNLNNTSSKLPMLTSLDLTNNNIGCCENIQELQSVHQQDPRLSIKLNQCTKNQSKMDLITFINSKHQSCILRGAAPHSKGNNKNMIIIIVCSVVGGLLVVVLVIVCIVMKYKKRQKDMLFGQSPSEFVLNEDAKKNNVEPQNVMEYMDFKNSYSNQEDNTELHYAECNEEDDKTLDKNGLGINATNNYESPFHEN
eukprot:Pgem_evm1s18140